LQRYFNHLETKLTNINHQGSRLFEECMVLLRKKISFLVMCAHFTFLKSTDFQKASMFTAR